MSEEKGPDQGAPEKAPPPPGRPDDAREYGEPQRISDTVKPPVGGPKPPKKGK